MPSDTRKISRKDQILEAAKSLFFDQGFTATSMREISGSVGVEVPTLYSHFSNKEDILWNICEKKVAYFKSRMEEIRTIKSPEVALKELIETHIHIALEDPRGHSVFLHDWKFLNPKHKEYFLNERGSYEEAAIDLIKQGMASDIFVQMNPTIAFYTIVNAIRWVYRYDWQKGRFNAKKASAEIEDMILRGLLVSRQIDA